MFGFLKMNKKFSSVSIDGLNDFMKKEPNAILVDVRTPEEQSSGRAKNAISLNYFSNTFKSEIEKLDKDKVYLVYCRSGNRSAKACGIMVDLGFNNAYNLKGGFATWNNYVNQKN